MAKLNTHSLIVGIIICISTGLAIATGLLDAGSNIVLTMISFALLSFLCFAMTSEIVHFNTIATDRYVVACFALMVAQYATFLIAIIILGIVRDRPAGSNLRVSLVIDTILTMAMFLFFGSKDKDTPLSHYV
jgi:hypothetical protein